LLRGVRPLIANDRQFSNFRPTALFAMPERSGSDKSVRRVKIT
jgi:hypothetical protein